MGLVLDFVFPELAHDLHGGVVGEPVGALGDVHHFLVGEAEEVSVSLVPEFLCFRLRHVTGKVINPTDECVRLLVVLHIGEECGAAFYFCEGFVSVAIAPHFVFSLVPNSVDNPDSGFTGRVDSAAVFLLGGPFDD